ncbi:MAG: phosphoglycerate kinase [Opitutae bacterium]
MGLDQYAFARKGEPIETTEDFTYRDLDGNTHTEKQTSISYEESKQIAYWRKHPNLQGWMENLWRSNGGEGEFNCVDVELTLEDLDALEQTLYGKALPETQGFFFGENSDDFYAEQDREFIREARERLANGYKIIYTSWW